MEKFEIGDSVIYNADAFSVLPTLEDGSIDFCCSDPPYASESFGGKCTDCDWDKPVPLPEFWELIERKTKPQANVALFCNMKLAYDLIGSNKKGFRYDLTWVKNNPVGFFNANQQPMRSHENILLFGKPGNMATATFNPLKTAGTRPRVNRAKARKSGGVYPAGEAYTTISDGSVNPISVLAFDHDRKNQPGLHPTQKPVNLLAWLIFTYSNEFDIILDPFSGSSSCGEAALRLNRRYIGIEKDPVYYATACKRLEAVYQRKTTRRRLTIMTFPDHPTTTDQTASAVESADELTSESELQNCDNKIETNEDSEQQLQDQ